MPNIKNNHTGPLNIAGVEIPSGCVVKFDVLKFAIAQNNATVKVWLEQGILEVVSAGDSEPSDDGVVNLSKMNKDALIAHATSIGVEVDADWTKKDIIELIESESE